MSLAGLLLLCGAFSFIFLILSSLSGEILLLSVHPDKIFFVPVVVSEKRDNMIHSPVPSLIVFHELHSLDSLASFVKYLKLQVIIVSKYGLNAEYSSSRFHDTIELSLGILLLNPSQYN